MIFTKSKRGTVQMKLSARWGQDWIDWDKGLGRVDQRYFKKSCILKWRVYTIWNW